MQEIRSLQNIGIDELYAAFAEAFKDYGRSWTKDEFTNMLARRGYVAELSFGAFEDGKIVSFTLNGIGIYSGHRTAYDTGTGTIEAYRGKGLATKIFNESVPHLKSAGVEQYLLEVLQDNAAAVSVYKKIGFEVRRAFNYFFQSADKIKIKHKQQPAHLILKQHEINNQIAAQMWDFEPSWQNSFESLRRNPEEAITITAFLNDEAVGYGIIVPNSGDIPQMAVHKNYRRQGIATAVFNELMKQNKSSAIKVINTDTNCQAVTEFLAAQNIPLSGKQFEMIKKL